MTPLLEVSDLTVEVPSKHGPLKAVDSVSFHINPAEIVGVAGESGSGKTLSVLAVLGLLPPNVTATGQALFQGKDLVSMSRRGLRAIRGSQIGIVFQDPMNSLHPMLTIGKQMTEHQLVHRGISRRAAREQACALLETVRIPNPIKALDRHPHNFSGGMRQRIAIAMALVCEPSLLIADEPTTALDVTVQAGILQLIDELRREHHLAVVMITHDLGVLSSIADRIHIFYAGRVMESGSATEVLSARRHPYTKGLLEALPNDQEIRPLTPIRGAPPPLGARPTGCPFHPRCQYAVDECRVTVPPLIPIGDGRALACTLDPLRPGAAP